MNFLKSFSLLMSIFVLSNLTLNIEAAVSSCYTGSSVNGVGTVAATSCGAGYSYCYVTYTGTTYVYACSGSCTDGTVTVSGTTYTFKCCATDNCNNPSTVTTTTTTTAKSGSIPLANNLILIVISVMIPSCIGVLKGNL